MLLNRSKVFYKNILNIFQYIFILFVFSSGILANKDNIDRKISLNIGNISYATGATPTLERNPPPVRTISLPDVPNIVSGTCPDNLIENHISICGTAKTIDINTKDGVENVQEAISGATVAVYLGAKYAQGVDDNGEYLRFATLRSDPNNTGEIAGMIEGLYTYTITNDTGQFIIPAPKGKGTNGMLFLAFFCGEDLKDLYMLDSSRTLTNFNVSLACRPNVTPASREEATAFGSSIRIPAPPSVNYIDRLTYRNCEDKNDVGNEGDSEEYDKTISIPLYREDLDDSRVGAEVRQEVTAECVLVEDVYDEYGNPVWGLGDLNYGTFTFMNDNGKEVPPTTTELSRRDLEGFTHSSLGYSLQAISSLNCGTSGCYDTRAPKKGSADNTNDTTYLPSAMVALCNTSPFPPLRCKGPAIELAEPGEWTRSYYDQRRVNIYNDTLLFNNLGNIVLPQYGVGGQYIRNILRAWGLPLSVYDSITWRPGDDGDLLWEQLRNLPVEYVDMILALFDELGNLIFTPITRGWEMFPYSTVLNYDINKKLVVNFENRPTNDSYVNSDGDDLCVSDEEARRLNSLNNPGNYPFKACYGAILPGEDTYSAQKALYLTTKNTEKSVEGETIEPGVQRFIAPNEQIYGEMSPDLYSLPSSVSLEKVGKGYWRIGGVQTLCTRAEDDFTQDLIIDNTDYPVLAVYGTDYYGPDPGDDTEEPEPGYCELNPLDPLCPYGRIAY